MVLRSTTRRRTSGVPPFPGHSRMPAQPAEETGRRRRAEPRPAPGRPGHAQAGTSRNRPGPGRRRDGSDPHLLNLGREAAVEDP